MKKILSTLLILITVFSCSVINANASDNAIILTKFDVASIHTQTQKGFLSSPVEYYSYYGTGVKENSRPKAVTLSWSTALSGTFTVKISENEDLSNSVIYETTNKKIDVYNLKIATKYFWCVSNGDFVSDVSYFVTEGHFPRNIFIENVSNVRDLGGFSTTDGGSLRQGLLYRGGRFNKVNAAPITISEKGAKTLVNTLGIKTEIDLRVDSEIGGWTESILNTFDGMDRKVEYYICPLDPSDKKPYYYLLRDNNIASTKKVFELLADENNYPIYFHCSLGTDRAGELSDILHYLCSVSPDDVDYDYAFSNLANIGSSRDYTKPSRTELKKLILNYGDKVDSKSTAACLKDKLGLSDETINNIIRILKDDSTQITPKSQYTNNCLMLKPDSNLKSSFALNTFSTGISSNFSLQMKVKSSKNIVINNAIRIGNSTENLDSDYCFDVSFSTEWQTINLKLPNESESLKKYISFSVPENNKGLELFFDDVVLLNSSGTVNKVFNSFQHYLTNYNFVNGTDYVGSAFDGTVKVVEDKAIFIPSLELSMLKGAEMRIDGKKGLRFITTVNSKQYDDLVKNGYSVEFGTLIAPADFLSDLNDLTFDLPSSSYLLVPYKKELINGKFKGSLVNILESSTYNQVSGNLNRGFLGRGYARIYKNDFEEIVYADLDDNVRSISEISFKYKTDQSSDYMDLSDVLKAFIDKWASFYLDF